MNSGSVGGPGGIELSSVNSKDGPALGSLGEQVSQNHTAQLNENLTSGKEGSFVQLFQHKLKETFIIEGQVGIFRFR